jgi:hypothetical protein
MFLVSLCLAIIALMSGLMLRWFRPLKPVAEPDATTAPG